VDEVRKVHRHTQKLDGALNVFKDDHKAFKSRFIFQGKDQYMEVPQLLTQLNRILMKAIHGENSDGNLSMDEMASFDNIGATDPHPFG
jgi:hypothetical protein